MGLFEKEMATQICCPLMKWAGFLLFFVFIFFMVFYQIFLVPKGFRFGDPTSYYVQPLAEMFKTFKIEQRILQSSF